MLKIKNLALIFLSFSLFFSCAQKQESILDKVIQKKILRVGITLDNPPYAFRNKSNEPAGIDVEMMAKLANSLDAEVQFIPTNWNELNNDLLLERFDIAVGGVSRKAIRQRSGLFSDGYWIEGKTALVRCDSKSKYQNLSDLDQVSVKILVKAATTDQSFADRNLLKAQIIQQRDSDQMISDLKNKKADAIIMDATQVFFESKQDESLCPGLAGQDFERIEKSYLLPRDEIWKDYVNTWIREQMTTGKIEETFLNYLN